MPYMKFLSVGTDVCRRLPSGSTSRWTPLPWAIAFPLLGWLRDLHPLNNAHAERTNSKRTGETNRRCAVSCPPYRKMFQERLFIWCRDTLPQKNVQENMGDHTKVRKKVSPISVIYSLKLNSRFRETMLPNTISKRKYSDATFKRCAYNFTNKLIK